MRSGSDSLAWGTKGRISLSPFFGASNAFRTDSVLAMTTPSGSAAATRPFRDAMLRSEAVGAGGWPPHFEVSWTLASPAIERKPRPWK